MVLTEGPHIDSVSADQVIFYLFFFELEMAETVLQGILFYLQNLLTFFCFSVFSYFLLAFRIRSSNNCKSEQPHQLQRKKRLISHVPV